MNREASEDENDINEPSYFCYKAYLKYPLFKHCRRLVMLSLFYIR
ncbi:unnamed protein product [Brugia pahangi]|uniref:Uncharacterized protein n=1 Tax=Brugia pahangi TaxID=6280 RepID=A0A0N4TFD7_BRUPA|nr:unnamed protein product [Brugia pahangi]